MSDGGRGRAALGVEVWKSSQKWRVQRSAVRSIAWLDAGVASRCKVAQGKWLRRKRVSAEVRFGENRACTDGRSADEIEVRGIAVACNLLDLKCALATGIVGDINMRHRNAAFGRVTDVTQSSCTNARAIKWRQVPCL